MTICFNSLVINAAGFTVDNLNYTLLSATDLTCSLAAGNYQGKLVIPATVNYNGRTLTVIAIDDGAIKDLPELTEVEIGKNVRTIGKYAFNNTPKLEKLVIPATVDRIEWFSFVKCGIKELVMEASDKPIWIGMSDYSTKIGYPSPGTFIFCRNLEKVTWERGYKQIEDNSRFEPFTSPFGSTHNIDGVSHESTVKEVIIGKYGSNSFGTCNSVESVTFLEGVEKVGGFSHTKIKSVVCPSTAKVITLNGFEYCEELSEVILNEGLEEIGRFAFTKAPIKQITIPSSVSTMGVYIFSNLEKVRICTNCDYANSFTNCKNLREITFAPTVNTVNPATAFQYCTDLQTITVENPIPPTVKGEFTSDQYFTTKVYCPINSVDDYRNAPIWKNFWNIEGKEMDLGVDDVKIIDSNIKYFSPDGVLLKAEPETGTFIKVEGGKASKILKK